MCTRITCPKCNKPSYTGCGAHVELVLGDVPKADRCRCRDETALEPERRAPAAPAPGGLWKRILGGGSAR
jgi:hypothetical protein